eukprot:TRINITY_DN16367_c0_g1_i3.p1 TRINITY_DN16367_c0_g1~~TRINITY_DN16367_c0_g1_i3.p1  ORF type:complete len:166 (+),score=38.51 TRINITY_DN16367_c0_g1_i3:60-557(+)
MHSAILLLLALVVCGNAFEATNEYLVKVVKENGYDLIDSAGADAVMVAVKADKEMAVHIQWEEQSTLKLTAMWASHQKGPEADMPIINNWNNHRRFAKVSVHWDDSNTQTTIVMQMDQIVVGDDEFASKIIIRSLEIFSDGIKEFDSYLARAYSAAGMKVEEDEA